ncbi:carbon monoxide dehydrogenase [Rhodococcus sp. 06-156-3C]|uniref:SRPBCC family protein n=1 Tax=Nocardiaceae TaxID=85025 RepID=UPI000522F94C|nr:MULTISPECIES: SRPBCC family protein [Rhodococcus]OZD12583.1 carbon monoxide dehydrogenase [Rhodococcus sp. 06-156-4a]OZD18008.1 carbon monoxide dehydrogenase [Rhodococcus sp. 06-156-3C]OZD20432.1 carbon monoxide dehydrogenase [Rhodococcus sp. 06-156-4C]OZD29276.1 carbon monoxide dehydrogenase [Rhodococcus sp. 06-156-3]OZD30548.1 carbon monoxide dehydrogenase [Rhodococcus sp. 06-156-3b]
MELTNTFVIEAPIDDVWKAFNDPEFVAPCFPGADLTEYTGDSFTGGVKVKLGPVSLKYKGKGTYMDRNESTRVLVIDAEGRDTSGNGTARALVTGSMESAGATRTSVTMVTDLNITGRPAQFGRGIMSDVADKIIGQFASRLADKLNGAAGSETDEAPAGSEDSLDILGAAMVPVLRIVVPGVLAALLAVVGYRLLHRR